MKLDLRYSNNSTCSLLIGKSFVRMEGKGTDVGIKEKTREINALLRKWVDICRVFIMTFYKVSRDALTLWTYNPADLAIIL